MWFAVAAHAALGLCLGLFVTSWLAIPFLVLPAGAVVVIEAMLMVIRFDVPLGAAVVQAIMLFAAFQVALAIGFLLRMFFKDAEPR
jgi:hypothetical protein